MIKIIAYRTETALVEVLREKMNRWHKDEARSLARQIFQTEADLTPDLESKSLRVQIHSLGTPKDNEDLAHLCSTLTETETIYPGSEMKLIFETVSV